MDPAGLTPLENVVPVPREIKFLSCCRGGEIPEIDLSFGRIAPLQKMGLLGEAPDR
jgi:hypothetical protein